MNGLDELASATSEADALDAQLQEQTPQEVSPVDQWAAMLDGVVTMVAGPFPLVRSKYPEPYVKVIAEPLSQLAAKYGWSPGSLPPEVMLPVLLLMPWMPEIMAHIKSRKETNNHHAQHAGTGANAAPVPPV